MSDALSVIKVESPYKPEILWLCVSSRLDNQFAPTIAPKNLRLNRKD